MSDETLQLDELDRLATEAFPGLVVRKDLLRRMRSGFSVPAFVIEFLLGKYCASTDEEEIREGLEFVRETLGAKFVKPDEREAVKSSIKQHSTYEIIDKISVRLVETHDKYWARLSNLNQDFINIDDSVVREHDRLLMGGIWAEIVLRYDDSFIFKDRTDHSSSSVYARSNSPHAMWRVSWRGGGDSRLTSGSTCCCAQWAMSQTTRTIRAAENYTSCSASSHLWRKTTI